MNKDAGDSRGSGPSSWWDRSGCPSPCSVLFLWQVRDWAAPGKERLRSQLQLCCLCLSSFFPPEVSAGFDEAMFIPNSLSAGHQRVFISPGKHRKLSARVLSWVLGLKEAYSLVSLTGTYRIH